MILGLQIIALLFSLVMIYLAQLNFKRREINKLEMGVWTVAWSIAIVMVVFPDTLRAVAQSFLISRLLDLMFAGGFMLVLAMVSMTYVRSKKLEKKLEKYVRSEALNQLRTTTSEKQSANRSQKTRVKK